MQLLKQIRQIGQGGLRQRIQAWEQAYGAAPAPALIEIAVDHAVDTEVRYIAVIAALKLGGAESQSRLAPLLGDPDPFIRYGIAMGFAAGGATAQADLLYPCLTDRALIVRQACLRSLRSLQAERIPPPKLSAMLMDERNYAHDTAMPIVFETLDAIQATGDPTALRMYCDAVAAYPDPRLSAKIRALAEGLLKADAPSPTACFVRKDGAWAVRLSARNAP